MEYDTIIRVQVGQVLELDQLSLLLQSWLVSELWISIPMPVVLDMAGLGVVISTALTFAPPHHDNI